MGTARYSERENIFPNRPHWDENGVFVSAPNDRLICWCPKDTIQEDHLCSFCRDLRLRHLIFCGEPKMIDLGRLSAFMARTGCNLCSLFALGCKQILGEEDKFGMRLGTQSPCYINALDIHKQQIRGYPLQLSIASQWVDFEIVLKKEEPHPALVDKSFEIYPKVDIVFLQTMLHNCEENHSGCKGNQTATPEKMCVIDLRNMNIVPAPYDCRYCALSYVWGRITKKWLTLTRENILTLGEKYSLLDSHLPRTIRDAMQLCTELGERYLWVDSLCIVQDDPVFQKQQIDIMDASAAFTIVAAAGDHADAGLPGVSTWLRDVKRQTTTIQDIEISNVLPKIRDTIERSIWNTRGWTYQERMFSKRCICLTEAQAFYTCSTGVEYEVKDRLLPNGYGKERFRGPPKTADLRAVYSKNVTDYSLRSLTNQADILRAFQGVMNEMSRQYGQSFYYGLPHLDFQIAILWQQAAQAVPREVPGVVLPSWSWASVNGAIKYSFAEEIITPESRTALPAFWQDGEAPDVFQLDPLLSVDDLKLIRLKQPSASIHNIENLSLLTIPGGTSNPPPDTFIQFALQKPGRLLFSTQLTSLLLLNSVPFKTADSWWTDYTTCINLSHISMISILNPNSPDPNDPVGFMELDKTWASQHLPTNLSTDAHKWAFIALSLASTKAEDYMHRHFTQRRNINYPLVYSRNVRRLIVNVMLIERKHEDGGVAASRLGIGKIYLDHWEEAAPKMEWVVLE